MSVLHTEVTDLDEDPNLPSLAYQAHENVPIFIPLSHKSIALGIGFDSSIVIGAQPSSALFRPSALISTSGKALYELDMEEGCSSFRQSSSSKAATSYEHMDFKGTLSAGGSLFGVTGRAQFTQDVSGNTDVRCYPLFVCIYIYLTFETSQAKFPPIRLFASVSSNPLPHPDFHSMLFLSCEHLLSPSTAHTATIS